MFNEGRGREWVLFNRCRPPDTDVDLPTPAAVDGGGRRRKKKLRSFIREMVQEEQFVLCVVPVRRVA